MPKTTLGPPEIIEGIGSLTYLWPDVGIEVEAKRLRDEGRAELWFYSRNGIGKKGLLHVAEVNLLASPTMNSLAKRMATHAALPWSELLTDVTSKTMIHLRQGNPGVVIHGLTDTARHPGYYLKPTVMKGVPNIIFGDKGVNKTTLCLLLLGLIRLGFANNKYGFQVDCGETPVALLDWESNQALTEYTLSRIARGDGPIYDLAYLRCHAQPLADDAERIGNFLSEKNIQVFLVDSLGAAAGSDRYDSSGKGAALRFFETLGKFNRTPIIIAQNAKGEDARKTIFGSTYFTYYSRNIFELRRAEIVNPDELSIGLFHQESNYSRKFEPMGFHLTYTEDAITIEPEEVQFAQFSERVSQTKRILDYLKDGAKSLVAIAQYLESSNAQTSVVLYRLKKAKKIVALGSSIWGLAST